MGAGCIEDPTRIWWDLRPSHKFPTLESRVTDVCSRVRDAGAVAAVYQSLLAYLWRLRNLNQRWRVYPSTLIRENRWRAQKYGAAGRLADHGRRRMAPFADLMEEIIDLVGPDAETLGCRTELLHARRIAAEGDSASRQRTVRDRALEEGASPEEALAAVVDSLIVEFREV